MPVSFCRRFVDRLLKVSTSYDVDRNVHTLT